MVQQVEKQGKQHQQKDRDQITAYATGWRRGLAGQLQSQDGDRLDDRSGTKNYRNKNCCLQGVKDQPANIKFTDIAQNILFERLPVSHGVTDDTDY